MGANTKVLRSPATRLLTAVTVVWFGLVSAPPAQAGSAVLVGAGDIADCGSSGDAPPPPWSDPSGALSSGPAVRATTRSPPSQQPGPQRQHLRRAEAEPEPGQLRLAVRPSEG